jgi:AcrR family transcriptional regulator
MARPRVREKILDAAHRLLNQERTAALTTRNIALEAGTTEASVFNNFMDKSGLFRALINERLVVVQQLVKVIEDDAMPIETWLAEVYLSARASYLEVMPLAATLLKKNTDLHRILQFGPLTLNQAVAASLARRGLFSHKGNDSAEQEADFAAIVLGSAMHGAVGEVFDRSASISHAPNDDARRITEMLLTLLVNTPR